MTGTVPVFGDFISYWHFAQHLSERQRTIIFNSLSETERKLIETTYETGGWRDVTQRNHLEHVVDKIKKQFGYNLIEIRAKVLKGKSVYLPRVFWHTAIKMCEAFSSEDASICFGSIVAEQCPENHNVILLTRASKKTE